MMLKEMKPCLSALAVALVIIAVLMGIAWKRADNQWHQIYGINPGKVEYKTSTGGKGMMMVRDLDNAEEEIQVQFKADWELFKAKGFELQSEEQSPKITILKKIPAE